MSRKEQYLYVYNYLLIKEHIVLRASTQGLPDLVHIQLDIQVIDLSSSGRGGEQPSQNGSKIQNLYSLFVVGCGWFLLDISHF